MLIRALLQVNDVGVGCSNGAPGGDPSWNAILAQGTHPPGNLSVNAGTVWPVAATVAVSQRMYGLANKANVCWQVLPIVNEAMGENATVVMAHVVDFCPTAGCLWKTEELAFNVDVYGEHTWVALGGDLDVATINISIKVCNAVPKTSQMLGTQHVPHTPPTKPSRVGPAPGTLPDDILLHILLISHDLQLIGRAGQCSRSLRSLIEESDVTLFLPFVREHLAIRKDGKEKEITEPVLPVRFDTEPFQQLLRVGLTYSRLLPVHLPALLDESSWISKPAPVVMSSLLPPPPKGCSWADRRIVGTISVSGSTGSVFPMRVYASDGEEKRREEEIGGKRRESLKTPTNLATIDTTLRRTTTTHTSSLSAAHFQQSPPRSGSGDLLALSLSDLRPKLTRAVTIGAVGHRPLEDISVRSDRFCVRRWEEGMCIWVEVMDSELNVRACLEGPGGVDALRRMRDPGSGVLCGGRYGLVCHVTGTLQMWNVSDDVVGALPPASSSEEAEGDLAVERPGKRFMDVREERRTSSRRLLWIKGLMADSYVSRPAMNERCVAAIRRQGPLDLFTLSGDLLGTIPARPVLVALEPSAVVHILMTRCHLLVLRQAEDGSTFSLACHALAPAAPMLWEVDGLAFPDPGCAIERAHVSDDDRHVIVASQASLMVVDVEAQGTG
ncbi:hypothetical protein HK101_001610, partial [Irineochytrium annulatum]